MDDRIDPGQRCREQSPISNIGPHELRLVRHVSRPSIVVHLLDEGVVDADRVPLLQQQLDYVRTDKAGAAGNQNVHQRSLAGGRKAVGGSRETFAHVISRYNNIGRRRRNYGAIRCAC